MTLLDAPPHVEKKRHTGLAVAVALLLASVLGLGTYAWHMKRHAEGTQRHIAETKPMTPPVTGPQEQIALLVAYDEDGSLHRHTISVPMPSERSERARQAVHTLIDFCSNGDSPHPMPQGADVKTVYLVSNNLAVIDVNSALADTHRSGILVEELTIASIAQTLAANVPGITRVRFLVDGKERDTLAGHADLKTYYDVAGLNAFVLPGEAPRAPDTTAPAKKETQ